MITLWARNIWCPEVNQALLWCFTKGIGCLFVTCYAEWLVAYASQSLQQAEQKYGNDLVIVFAVKLFHQSAYWWEFTLVTDHWLLCKIFSPKKGVSPLAATKMQRWDLPTNTSLNLSLASQTTVMISFVTRSAKRGFI